MPISQIGSTGTDWQRKTPQYATAITTTNSATLSTVVSVTGKGIITDIGQVFDTGGYEATGQIDVIVDGVQMHTDMVFTPTSANGGSSAGFSPFWRFNTGFTVKHRMASTATSCQTNVCYVLD